MAQGSHVGVGHHDEPHLAVPSVPRVGQRGSPGCTVRTIVIGPGTYRWRIFSAHCAHADQTQWQERRLHLRHARYEWHDCWAIEGERWTHHSVLHNRTHGGSVQLRGGEINGSFGDGSYHIGSTLDNVRR
jgi:hypothetical protein